MTKPKAQLPFNIDELHQIQIGMELLIDNYRNTLKHTPGMKGSFLSDEDYKAFEEVLRTVEGIKANVVAAQAKLQEQHVENVLVKRLLRDELDVLEGQAFTHANDNPTGCTTACETCKDLNTGMGQIIRLLERD